MLCQFSFRCNACSCSQNVGGGTLRYFLLRTFMSRQCFVMSRLQPYNYVLRKKNAPGGDLIRVDLIRFPGSIPGGRQDVHQLIYTNYT